MSKSDKELKRCCSVFCLKKFSKKKSFWSLKDAGAPFVPNRVMSYSPLALFSFLTFHFSLPRIYQENNFCCVYKFWNFNNSAKFFSFLTDFLVFPLRLLWHSFWSSEYFYFLAFYFFPKFLMFLTCSELHTISA